MSSLRTWALWSRFSSRISLYFALFTFLSILTSLPVPATEKHPHSMMLPPPCFIIGMVHVSSRALRTSDWGEGSPSNRTTTLNTQPRQCRCGFGTSLWMSLSGPARDQTLTRLNISGETGNSCATTLPIQPDRAWENLLRRLGQTPQIQVCQACSIMPKKTQGCNRGQRCFNKVLSKGSEYLCKCDICFCIF